MLRLLLFISALQCVFCGFRACPDHWIDQLSMSSNDLDLAHSGQCRTPSSKRDESGDAKGAAKRAADYCDIMSLNPVIIHTDEQQSYWKRRQNNGGYFTIALTCNNFSKKWEWIDGSAIDYLPYDNYKPNYDAGLDQDCANGDNADAGWYMNLTNGRWSRLQQSSGKNLFGIACAGQLPPKPPRNVCGDFEEAPDGSCFQVFSSNTNNWQYAQSQCQSIGAQLASIHSQEANAFVHRLAVSNQFGNGIFLGGKLNWLGTGFDWSDGSKWNYNNTAPGYPMSGKGDCLAMDTFSSEGKWVNADCSSWWPYACVRPSTVPVCPSEPLFSDSYDAQYIYSPGYPNDASIPCDYELSVPKGWTVRVEIEELQANSCCDYLLFTENKIGGDIIARVTGMYTAGYTSPRLYTSRSNTMRISWQPNGGVNVKGFKLKFFKGT